MTTIPISGKEIRPPRKPHGVRPERRFTLNRGRTPLLDFVSHVWGEGLNWRRNLRVSDVGRIEGLLLEIVRARSGKCPEGRVWEVLERLTEEVLLLREDRERNAVLDRVRDLH